MKLQEVETKLREARKLLAEVEGHLTESLPKDEELQQVTLKLLELKPKIAWMRWGSFAHGNYTNFMEIIQEYEELSKEHMPEDEVDVNLVSWKKVKDEIKRGGTYSPAHVMYEFLLELFFASVRGDSDMEKEKLLECTAVCLYLLKTLDARHNA